MRISFLKYCLLLGVILACLGMASSVHATSSQVLEFTAYVVDPAEGAYDQPIFVKGQIIKRTFDESGETVEEVVWDKEWENIEVYNGYLHLYFEEDDEGRRISANSDEGGVFQSAIDYSFDSQSNQDLVARAVYPDGTYAIRIYMKRVANEDWEQIKPDFNIDGSPFSLSSIDLTGYDKKAGSLKLVASSEDPDDTRAVLETDTLENRDLDDSFRDLQRNHGVYLKDATLTIRMDQANSEKLAFDIQGSVYLQNSQMLLGGQVTLERGNVYFNSLCMADAEACLNASSTALNGVLYAYDEVTFAKFEDIDAPRNLGGVYAGLEYKLDPGGQSNFFSLTISNQTTVSEPFTLLFKQGSNLNMIGDSELFLTGDTTKLNFTGTSGLKINMDIRSDKTLNHLLGSGNIDLEKFRLKPDGTIDTDVLYYYKQPNFFKVQAGRLVNPPIDDQDIPAGEFYIKPSKTSRMRALQFHFEDKILARNIINKRVRSNRFPGTSGNRDVSVLFDPLLSKEVLDEILGNQITNFHNHDLISQAGPEELIEIINRDTPTPNVYIEYENIDPSLARMPVFNRWQKQFFFGITDQTQLYQGSSFLSRGEIISSYGADDNKEGNEANRVKQVFGAEVNDDTGDNYGYMGTYNIALRSMILKNPDSFLDVEAGGLTLMDQPATGTGPSFQLGSPPTGDPLEVLFSEDMTVHGEFSLDGNLTVDQFLVNDGGRSIFGCFPGYTHCETLYEVSATGLRKVGKLGADIFYDFDNDDFYLDPDQESRLNRLTVKGTGDFKNRSVTILQSLSVTVDITAANAVVGTTGGFVEANYFDHPNNLYNTDLDQTSNWNNLILTGTLLLEGNDASITVQGKTSITGTITASSADVTLDSTVRLKTVASRYMDLDSDNGSGTLTMFIDPDSYSLIQDLTVEEDLTLNGIMAVAGQVSQGTTMVIQRNLTVNNDMISQRFIDDNDTSYLLDPGFQSRMRNIESDSLMSTEYLSANDVQIGNDLNVLQNADFRNHIRLFSDSQFTGDIRQKTVTGVTVFEIKNPGDIYAKSAVFTKSITVDQSGDLSGNVIVKRNARLWNPTYFQTAHVHSNQYFQIRDSLGNNIYTVDSAGNTLSVSGGLQSVTHVRFLTGNAHMVLRADEWNLGPQNALYRDLDMKRADNTYLDIASQNLITETTDASSRIFTVNNQVKMEKLIDSDIPTFSAEPSKTNTLNQMAVFSTVPVTVPTVPVRSPFFSDLEIPELVIDPSSHTRIRDLTADTPGILNNSLAIQPDTTPTQVYNTKLQFKTSLTTGNATVFGIDSAFSLSRLAHLTSNLDFHHRGTMEIINSDLHLGTGASQTSIGKLSMTTLIILPNTSYNLTFQTTFPEYFADHLHSHDEIANVDGDLIARKSFANIFLGRNRFVKEQESVILDPGSTSGASWVNTGTTNINSHFPYVLPRAKDNSGFYIGYGYTDINLSTPNSTVQSFITSSVTFSTEGNAAAGLNFRAMHASIDYDSQNLYFSGGVNGGGTLNNGVQRFSSGAFSAHSFGTPRAYHQSLSHKDNLYVFGGYFESSGMIYPSTFSEAGAMGSMLPYGNNISFTSQMSLPSIIYSTGNTLYRNLVDFSKEQVIHTDANGIRAPAISPAGIDVCYHTDSQQLRVYNLVSEQQTDLGVAGGHCQWAVNSESDWIYYKAGNQTYGQLSRIKRDGTGSTVISTTSNLDIRDLVITESGSVNMVGRTTLPGFSGERILVKRADNSFDAIDSDDSDQSTLLPAGPAYHSAQVHGNQIYALSSASSSNSRTNLFLLNHDGSDARQITNFVQGIHSRPVLLDSQEALVAVSGYYQEKNKLPAIFESACSAQVSQKVYLFGSGGSQNGIIEYDRKKDKFHTLSETIPFSFPFSCAYDSGNRVYFQSENKFHYFDITQKKFWALPDIPPPATTNSGSLAYLPTGSKVFFLEQPNAAPSRFYEYNVASRAWSIASSPAVVLEGTQIIGLGSRVYAFGNNGAAFNQIYDDGGGSWSLVGGYPGTAVHSPVLLKEDSSHILILGGSTGASSKTSIYRFDTGSNSFTSLQNLRFANRGFGVSIHDQHIYIYGGTEDNRILQVHPRNANSSSDFQQIYRVNLDSSTTSWETSSTDWKLATPNWDQSLIAYQPSNRGINLYNLNTKVHSAIIVGGAGTLEIDGLVFARDNNWIYYSRNDSGSQGFFRITTAPSGNTNLSTEYLNGATGTLQFLTEDHERLYFTNSGKVYYSHINASLPPVEVGSFTNAAQALYYEDAVVTQRRDGLLFSASSTNFSDLSTEQFQVIDTIHANPATKGELVLHEVARDSSGNRVLSAQRHYGTTNIYYLENGKDSPVALTNYSGNDFAVNPSIDSDSGKIFYSRNQGSFQLVENYAGTETVRSNGKLSSDFGSLLEPRVHRNRSFLFENRAYTFIKNSLYRSQVLTAGAAGLNWQAHDVQSKIQDNFWQVTQHKNKIYLFEEQNKTIYQYFPDDFALNKLGVVQTALSSGVLAATTDAFYFVGNGSIQQIEILTNPDSLESVQVYSAAYANADSTPIELFSMDPTGKVFAKRLVGTANFTDQSVSGGAGDLGILDGSIIASDLQTNAITNAKVKDLSFKEKHFVDNQISSVKFANNGLDETVFQTSVLNSTKISNQAILERHLGVSTLETNRISDSTLSDVDFDRYSLNTTHIQTNTIDATEIRSDTIISANIEDLTLLNSDFASNTLSSEHFVDGSIQDIDIQTLTMTNSLFQTGSVVTTHVIALSVTSDKIASLTLTSDKFLNYTIENSDIAAHNVTGELLTVGALQSANIIDDSSGIATQNLSDLSITWDKIDTDAIDTTKIDTDAIQEVDIADLTISNRELGPGSIDTNTIVDDTLVDSVFNSTALTIGKLADAALDTSEFENNSIIDRHFFSGGLGALSTSVVQATVALGARNKPSVALYENFLYVAGGGVAGGYKLNLSSRETEVVTALAGLGALNSAFAHNSTTFYMFHSSTLLAFDFNTESTYVASNDVFEGSNDNSGSALMVGNQFILFGGAGTHGNKVHSFSAATGNWTTHTDLPASLVRPAVAYQGGTYYVFGNGNRYDTNDLNGAWATSGLNPAFDLEGAQVVIVDNTPYSLGGTDDSSAVFSMDFGSNNITQLTSQEINIGPAGNNRLVYYQRRSYILSFDGSNNGLLLIWHPFLDASIEGRHIDDNEVTSDNIATNSLSSINFATDSIETNRVQDGEITNVDIEFNTLTTNSIAELIFTSSNFMTDSILASKLDTASVDSRVISDRALQDSDFATDSIDSAAMSEGAIDQNALHPFAITSEKIAFQTISLSKVSALAVTGEDIRTSEIQTVDIGNLSIQDRTVTTEAILSSHVFDGDIKSRHLMNLSIKRILIATETLTNRVFSNDAFNSVTMVRNLTLGDRHIATANILASKISSQAGDVLTNSKFQTNSLTSDDLAQQSITEIKIATHQIEEKFIIANTLQDRSFAANTIKTHHLIDGSLSHFQLSTNTLNTTDFTLRTITGDQVETGAVRSGHIISWSLNTEDFADASIGAIITNSSINSSQIVLKALTSADYADDSVTTFAISTATIIGSKVKTNEILSNRVADLQILRDKIKPDTLQTSDFINSSINKTHLLSANLSGEHLIINNLITSKLEDFSISGSLFTSATIPTSKLSDLAIPGAAFAHYQIVTDSIVDASILTSHIKDGSVPKIKLATFDVFGSQNMIDESIRGESIVSYSLIHEALATDAIRQDLIIDNVVNALSSVNTAGATYDATITNADLLKDVQAVGDGFYVVRNTSGSTMEYTTDFANYSTLGTGLCNGDEVDGFSFLGNLEGFIACDDRDIYFTEDGASTSTIVTSISEKIKDIHFFDRSNGILMTQDGTNRESIWYTSNGGVRWTTQIAPVTQLMPWTIVEDTVVVGDQDNGTFGVIYKSANRGASFTNEPLDGGGSHARTLLYGLRLNPVDLKLYAVYWDGSGATNLAEITNYGTGTQNVSQIVPAGLQAAFNASNVYHQPVIVNGKIFLFTNTGTYGVWEYNLSNNDFFQIEPDVTGRDDINGNNPAHFQSPIYVQDQGILFHTGSANQIWRLNQYDHIKSASLTSASLASSALTTMSIAPRSLANSNFGTGVIGSVDIRAASLNHGDYLVSMVSGTGYRFMHVGEDGRTVYAVNGSNLYKSTDSGVSFASIYDGSPDTLRTVHGRSDSLIIGTSSGNLIISTDAGTSLTKITSTPFNSNAYTGYPLDANNFFAVGLDDQSQLIAAKYNMDQGTFVEIKDESTQATIVITPDGVNYPYDLEFVTGATAYLSIMRTTGGDWLYKTTNSGQSWTSVGAGFPNRPYIHTFRDGDYWLGQRQTITQYVGDTQKRSTTFPSAEGNIRDVVFINRKIGFVAQSGGALWRTADDGVSWDLVTDFTNVVEHMQVIDKDRVLVTGNALGTYVIRPQSSHQPFGEVGSKAFTTNSTLEAYQFVERTLTGDDIGPGALTDAALADKSLEGSKLADDSVSNQHIQSRVLDKYLFEYESITNAKLATDGVAGEAFQDLIIDTNKIKDGTISSFELSPSVLSSDVFSDGSIQDYHIATESFYGSVFADSQVTRGHLIDESITENEFQTGIFNDSHFSENSISRAEFVSPNLNLQNGKVDFNQLTGASMGDGQIDSRLIADGSLAHYLFQTAGLVQTDLTDHIITTNKWRDDTILASILNSAIVSTSKVLQHAVSGEHILTNTLSRARFANTSIPAGKIQALSLDDREFSTDAIILGKLSVNPAFLLTSSHFDSAIITAGHLSGTYTSVKFADDAFSTTRIADRMFINSKLSAQIVTDGHMRSNELLSADLANSSVTQSKLKAEEDYATKLADNSITSHKVASHTLTNASLAGNITAAKLSTKLIHAGQIGNLTLAKIADFSVTGRVIQKYSLNDANFAGDAVRTAHLVSGGVYSQKIADDAILVGNMASEVVSGTHIADSALLNEDFAGNITGSKIQAATLTGGEFVDQFLGTSQITNASVTDGKLADYSLTQREIQNNAITTAKIENDSLGEAVFVVDGILDVDLADQIIDSSVIQDGTITNSRIGLRTLTSTHIADRNIGGDHFANDTITTAKFKDFVPQDRIKAGTITNADLSTVSTLNANRFKDDSIPTTALAPDSITTGKLINNTVNGSSLNSGILGSKLANYAVQTGNMTGGGFTTTYFRDREITEASIANGTLVDADFAANAVVAADIDDGTVPVAKLADFAINADAIAGGTVVVGDFKNNSINNDDITDGTLDATRLNLGNLTSANVINGELLYEDLADYAITDALIEDRLITSAHIANSQVDLDDVTSAITSRQINDGDLDGSKFNDDIFGEKFQNNTITSTQFSNTNFAQAKFAANIPRSKIQNNTISLDDFDTSGTLFNDDSSSGQAPGELLDQAGVGGNAADTPRRISIDGSNKAVIVGFSDSTDLTGNRGGRDILLGRVTEAGTVEVEKLFGSSGDDLGLDLVIDGDGDYIITGSVAVNDGDIDNGVSGSSELVVLDIANATTTITDNYTFGGSADEAGHSIIERTAGGFVIAGYTTSNNGDVSGNNGGEDFWVLGLDASFNLQWQNALGGSNDEQARDVVEADDGGFVVVGYSNSNDGDLTGNQGNRDFWIVKLTAAGSLEWQKNYGGSSNDGAEAVVKTLDGGYAVAGFSNSSDGDVTGGNGSQDLWIIRVDAYGDLEWNLTIGGTGDDRARDIIQHTDGSLVVIGHGDSNNTGDIPATYGSDDVLVAKVSAGGSLVWVKNLGSDGTDKAYSVAIDSNDRIRVSANVGAQNNDVTVGVNGGEGWVTRLKTDPKVSALSINASEFADDTFATVKIADGALTAAKISGTLDVSVIPSGAATAGKIANGGVGNAELFSDATGASANLIVSAQIKDNIIAAANVADGTITEAMLNSGDATFQKIFDFGGDDTESHAELVHDHNMYSTTCPTGFSNLGGTINFCISDADVTGTPENLFEKCSANEQARVCNFQELNQACLANTGTLGLTNGGNYVLANFSPTKIIGFTYSTGQCNFHQNSTFYNYNDSDTRRARCCVLD